MNEFLSTINHFEYINFRNRCIDECHISRTSWSKWINGGEITRKNKEIINGVAMELFSRPVFEEKGVEA